MLFLTLLLNTLEDLRQYDFEKFKFDLSDNVLDGCDPILPADLENATRVQTARKMIDSYGGDSAVKVTLEILEAIYRKDLAEQLESRYAAGKPATPSSSSSSIADPAASSSSSSIADPAASSSSSSIADPAASSSSSSIADPAASSSFSSIADPAASSSSDDAPAAMTAQHGAVIFAPNIAGGTCGSWNITINK